MALDNSTWRLVSLIGDAGAPTATPNPDHPITLSFTTRENGALSLAGSGGCNRYMTTYTTTDDAITIAPIASTRMMRAPDVIALEGRYLQSLGAATRYEEQGDDLTIFAPGAELHFTRTQA